MKMISEYEVIASRYKEIINNLSLDQYFKIIESFPPYIHLTTNKLVIELIEEVTVKMNDIV